MKLEIGIYWSIYKDHNSFSKCIGIEQCSFLYVLPQQQGAESHEEKKTKPQFGNSEGSSHSNAAANPSQL